MTLTVTIDSREKDRIPIAKKYFKSQGLNTSVKELPTGDYLFNNEVVFEFKVWSDFMASITDGRLFNETIKQMETYPIHFLVIHGTNRDYNAAYEHTGLEDKHITGSIARLLTYTKIIQGTKTLEDTFNLMMITAEKCLDDKILCKNFGTKNVNKAFNVLAFCVDDINAKRADTIVKFLDLHTIQDVCNLTHEKLIEVPGIGDILAEKILEAIGK